jgi:hypothetical protein
VGDYWSDKKGSLWWEGLYKWETTSHIFDNKFVSYFCSGIIKSINRENSNKQK